MNENMIAAIIYLIITFGSIVIGLYGTCFIARYKGRSGTAWVVATVLTLGLAHLILICLPRREPRRVLETVL